MHFGDTTAVPLEPMYTKRMRLINERIHSRTLLAAVLAYCTAAHFHPEAVTSRIVPFTDAAEEILDPAS